MYEDILIATDGSDQVGVVHPGRFNYHLNQLKGHFIRSTADMYQLREPGSIIVQAVLSGAMMRSPVLEPTELRVRVPASAATSR